MKKLLLLALLFPLFAQGATITTILGTDTLTASRAVINTNFSNLNSAFFSYPFPNNATTSSLTFGGLTLTGFSGGLGANTGVVYGAATTTFSSGLTYLNGNVTNNWGAGVFTYPFTSATTFTGVSTSTIIGFLGGMMATASSTIQIGNFGSMTIPSITSSVLAANTSGLVYAAATSTNAAFTFATSSFGTGTTTIPLAGFFGGTQVVQFGCTGRGGGTFQSRIGNGTASTTLVTSATGLTTTYTAISSNNAFASGVVIFWEFGTVSGAVANPSCSWSRI